MASTTFFGSAPRTSPGTATTTTVRRTITSNLPSELRVPGPPLSARSPLSARTPLSARSPVAAAPASFRTPAASPTGTISRLYSTSGIPQSLGALGIGSYAATNPINGNGNGNGNGVYHHHHHDNDHHHHNWGWWLLALLIGLALIALLFVAWFKLSGDAHPTCSDAACASQCNGRVGCANKCNPTTGRCFNPSLPPSCPTGQIYCPAKTSCTTAADCTTATISSLRDAQENTSLTPSGFLSPLASVSLF